jgi:hypothetical protein
MALASALPTEIDQLRGDGPKVIALRPYRLPTRLIAFTLMVLAGLSPICYGLATQTVGSHPLAAVALTPNNLFVAMASSRVALLPLLFVALLRLSIATPLHYLLGQRAIDQPLRRPPRIFAKTRNWVKVKRQRLIEEKFDRYGLLLVLVYPTAWTMIPAGAFSLPRIPVAICNLLGKLARLLLAYYVGTLLPIGPLLLQGLG